MPPAKQETKIQNISLTAKLNFMFYYALLSQLSRFMLLECTLPSIFTSIFHCTQIIYLIVSVTLATIKQYF